MRHLIDFIISDGITKVSKERFENILKFKDYVDTLPGDIVECGVWKGGMSIFLANVFPNKKLWIADSFKGFEGIEHSKYKYNRERHHRGGMAIGREIVEKNFNKFNTDISKVYVLDGYVNDTLPTCGIKEISLLRVDVDAYSATLEVLENLYDKVVSGGIIIFDDTCLYESVDAIRVFFNQRNIKIELKNPLDDTLVNINTNKLPCGCYMIKK
jgi:O-methyltransferase